MRARHSGVRIAALAAIVLWAVACGPSIDLKQDLQVADVRTGWFDAGIVVGGKNKLVPSISFVLRNASEHEVNSVQLNLAFWRKGEDGEFDGAFLATAIDRTGLAPGEQTPTITLRGSVGYTGEQPRAEMLQHRLFVDVTARLFVKRGSSPWVLLGEFPIERRLLTR
jgi:hypothetical protein